MCVKHVFNHYTAGGITLADLCNTLKTPVNWISYDHLHQLTGPWTGKTPSAISSGGFIIPVLYELGGEYRLVLMIRFEWEDNLTKEALVAALKGRLSPAERHGLLTAGRSTPSIKRKSVADGFGNLSRRIHCGKLCKGIETTRKSSNR
jgi:hypothetical protein